MKRYLLTAASALVITAAASAQTFKISGEVATYVTYDGSSNEFSGPLFDTYDMLLTFSGTGGGWDYQVDTGLDGSIQQVKLDNANLGTFELYYGEIYWSKNLLGDALKLSTQFETQDIVETLIIGLEGTAAGVSYETQIANDAPRTFYLELGVPFMGVEFGADVSGNLADTSMLDYAMEVGFDAFEIDTTVMWTSMGDIAVEAEAGPFYAETWLTDGDFFDEVTLGYYQEVTEQMAVHAQVLLGGGSTSGMAELTLRF